MALLLVLAAAVATVPALAGDAGSSPRPSRLFVDRGQGISLRYIDGWHVSNQRLNGIIDPVQRFVVSSYRIGPPSRSSGGAEGGYAPPADGVLAQLSEDAPAHLSGFPARLHKLTTIPKLRDVGCGLAGDRWAEIMFKQHGRAFYLFIGIGARASHAARAQLLATVNTLVIARDRPS
jgi:hypothetical protein